MQCQIGKPLGRWDESDTTPSVRRRGNDAAATPRKTRVYDDPGCGHGQTPTDAATETKRVGKRGLSRGSWRIFCECFAVNNRTTGDLFVVAQRGRGYFELPRNLSISLAEDSGQDVWMRYTKV